MCITFTGTRCTFPKQHAVVDSNTDKNHRPPHPPSSRDSHSSCWNQVNPGPKQAACIALTQACTTQSRRGGHGPGHAGARSTTQGCHPCPVNLPSHTANISGFPTDCRTGQQARYFSKILDMFLHLLLGESGVCVHGNPAPWGKQGAEGAGTHPV